MSSAGLPHTAHKAWVSHALPTTPTAPHSGRWSSLGTGLAVAASLLAIALAAGANHFGGELASAGVPAVAGAREDAAAHRGRLGDDMVIGGEKIIIILVVISSSSSSKECRLKTD